MLFFLYIVLEVKILKTNIGQFMRRKNHRNVRNKETNSGRIIPTNAYQRYFMRGGMRKVL